MEDYEEEVESSGFCVYCGAEQSMDLPEECNGECGENNLTFEEDEPKELRFDYE